MLILFGENILLLTFKYLPNKNEYSPKKIFPVKIKSIPSLLRPVKLFSDKSNFLILYNYNL